MPWGPNHGRGCPWDSIIAAGALAAVPPSGLPRAKGDVK